MFENVKFDKELETIRTDSADEAIMNLPKYNYQSFNGGQLKIRINEGQNIQLTCDGETFGISQWGYCQFLKKIRISPHSANAIDLDFLENLINNTLNRLSSSRSMLMIKRGNTIVNVGVAPYMPTRHESILKNLNKSSICDISQVSFNDRGLSVSLLDERIPVIEPEEGDIIRCGINLNNSETFGQKISVESYFLRLVCTNGSIMRERGHCFIPDKKQIRKYFSNISYLMDDIRSLSLKHDVTRKRLVSVIDKNLNDEELMQSWQILNKTFDSDRADSVLKLKYDDRKKIVNTVKERKRENRTLPHDNRIMPNLTEYGLYDVFNQITDAAKKATYHDSLELQRFGGSMLYWGN
jgi:hypothetical protein